MTAEDSTRGDVTTYVSFRRVADAIRTHFPSVETELDNLIDALEEDLVSKLALETMEDVRRLPDVLHQAAIIGLLDRDGNPESAPARSDWTRLQIIARPEMVRQLVGESDLQTAQDVARWVEQHGQ